MGARAVVLEMLEVVLMRTSIQIGIVRWVMQSFASFLDVVG